MRGSWRPNITAIFWPPLLWPSALCLSRSPGLLNRRPRGSAFCWVLAFSTTSCQQLLWTPTHQGSRGPLRPGVAFPTTLVYNSVSNCLTSVLTELYNSSTPTQSPSRSLEWHVWSSSSGNNCHAVQRSLSSGASVSESIMGFFTLSHFISQARPRDLFRLLAIGICHFLPVHHFVMACLPGPKVKIQHFPIGVPLVPNNKLDSAKAGERPGWRPLRLKSDHLNPRSRSGEQNHKANLSTT